MANLITEKQKKEVKIDYLIRLFSVSLLVPASLLGLFLLAYIIPYYLSVIEKDQLVAEQFKSVINVENKENVGESVSRIVAQTLNQMNAIEVYNKDQFIPSFFLNKIIASKNSSIKITKLVAVALNSKPEQFLVSGVAKNREGLVNFIEDLKLKAGFASVESPVSDFAKDLDISFNLTIKTVI
jgi:hypothetical protein